MHHRVHLVFRKSPAKQFLVEDVAFHERRVADGLSVPRDEAVVHHDVRAALSQFPHGMRTDIARAARNKYHKNLLRRAFRARDKLS